MKFFRILGRSIRDAFKSVGRNFSLSLASISCIIITLIIVAISIVVGYNVDNFSSELKKDLTIVYTKTGLELIKLYSPAFLFKVPSSFNILICCKL